MTPDDMPHAQTTLRERLTALAPRLRVMTFQEAQYPTCPYGVAIGWPLAHSDNIGSRAYLQLTRGPAPYPGAPTPPPERLPDFPAGAAFVHSLDVEALAACALSDEHDQAHVTRWYRPTPPDQADNPHRLPPRYGVTAVYPGGLALRLDLRLLLAPHKDPVTANCHLYPDRF